ncbi:MAG: hypothetical protein JWM33_1841 [Caulobacteraceae bacterium]|nr:hypothetical protein [Caulobacteraceae bacterium]
MSHPNTERLIEYWRDRKSGDEAPPRAAIDPAGFARLAPQTFIWGRESRGVYPFRLVGGAIGELFRRDLRGDNGLLLWRPKDALALGGALELILRRPEPLEVTALMRCWRGGQHPVELVFLPLAGPDGQVDRLLGLLQPLTDPFALEAGEATGFELTNMEAAGAPPMLRLAAAYGQAV